MVGFALSCFGLLLFLWLAFGGPTPLKPKGYRFKVSFGEATQLANEADVRISGVPVGKVKTIATNSQTGRSDADDRAQARVRADPGRRARDPAPEDAAGRDLRRADAGHQRRPEGRRRRAGSRQARSPTPSSSTRSCGRSTPRRARRSRSGSRPRPQAIDGRGQRPQRRARQPRAVRAGHHQAPGDPQRAEGRACASSCATPASSSRAVGARRPARSPHHELQPRVRDDGAARPGAGGGLQGAADVREGVEHDAHRA